MRRYEYSDEIVNVIKQFLEEDDWHYSFDEETGIFRFDLKIRSKMQKISYVIDVHNDESPMVCARLVQIMKILR